MAEMISGKRSEAVAAYTEKFESFLPFTRGGFDIPDEVLIPALRRAVERNRPLDTKEGHQIEHELWPDIYDENGGTKNDILI
ncbi:MAG: hypothetical protein LBJ76_07095 [Candidatus Accumulibacter sp.]|jgi:hypothetical protein|nr:hypothetical protein [Accumulibacter sp.]